jgi:hypothetical protein
VEWLGGFYRDYPPSWIAFRRDVNDKLVESDAVLGDAGCITYFLYAQSNSAAYAFLNAMAPASDLGRVRTA